MKLSMPAPYPFNRRSDVPVSDICIFYHLGIEYSSTGKINSSIFMLKYI